MRIVKLNSNVMRKNSLVPNKGLSLSQATSISNLCNQRAIEITSKLAVVNNLSKTVKVKNDNKIIVAAHPLPEKVADLLLEKAKLHACQPGIVRNLMLEHHPGRSCQFPGHRPDRDDAIRLGFLSFIETLRQWLKTHCKMCCLRVGP